MLSLGGKSKTLKSTALPVDEVIFDPLEEGFSDFTKLCYIFVHVGLDAFSSYLTQGTLDEYHYKEWLKLPEIHLSLRRLRCRGFFTNNQWNLLYPEDKSNVVFPPQDLSLSILLLKYTGMITTLESHNWLEMPNDYDQSSAAILVRLQFLRKEMAAMKKLSVKEFDNAIKALTELLCHFGGLRIKGSIDMIRQREFSAFEQAEYFERFKKWHKQEEQIFSIEKKLQHSRSNRNLEIPLLQSPITPWDVSPTNKKSVQQTPVEENLKGETYDEKYGRYVPRWSDIKTGIPEEEKDILRQFYPQLISEVRPDSMIDQLLSKKVLNIEESGEVFSSLRSTDQMSFLLDLLVTKTGQAFNEFLNSLKTRYYNLYLDMYEEYQRMKQEILSNRPEGVLYCHTYLINTYMKRYSNWSPILWYPESKTFLQNFYCPLQMLDSFGVQVEPQNILTHKTQKQPVRVIVVEGDPGTGKSFLSHLLASKWSTDPTGIFQEYSIKLLFHLDLKITAPNLKWMLFDQLFDAEMKLTEREVWEVIDKQQEICLFILDGYNDNVNDEVLQLINGGIFPNAFVIIFSNSASTQLLKGFYQEKYVLTGFKVGESVNFAKKYMKISKRSYDQFENLLQKLSKSSKRAKDQDNMESSEAIGENSDDQEDTLKNGVINSLDYMFSDYSLERDANFLSKQRAGSIIPGGLMGFSVPSLTKLQTISSVDESIPVDGKEASRMEEDNSEKSSQDKLIALRFYSQFPLYCSFFCVMTDLRLSIDLTSWSAMLEHFFTAIKMKLIERDKESRVAVNKMFNTLMELAFESVKQGISTAFVKESERIQKFGVMKKISSPNSNFSSKYLFSNDIIQNFLAAKCLDLYGVDETNNYFQNLTLNKSLYTLVVFYCGIRRNDFETPALRTLFRKIIDLNLQILLNDSDNPQNAHSKRSQIGNIMKFQLGLDCVAAMNGRLDLTQKVGQTLPEKLLVEHTCTIPVLTLQGLSFVINLSCKNIIQLDLRLNYLSRQTPDAFQNLANSIHQNTSIKTLRIFWEQLELMSLFFATVCEKNKSISVIECHDESNHKYENYTSRVAQNIRLGCRNMHNVSSFAFVDCTFPTLTHAIIRNLSDDLLSLDFSGCSFTIIACKDLAEKIEHTKCLKHLKLARVQMQSMAFNTFIRSVSGNRTVVNLCLNSVRMDNVCFFSLAESLKLNNRLEKLYILDVYINERSTEEIIQVLRVNTTLKEMYISEEKISPICRTELHKQAKYTSIICLNNAKARQIELAQENG